MRLLTAMVFSGALAIGAAPAISEPLNVQFTGQHKALFRDHANIAIPSYQINFVISHQGTASASVLAKSRLALALDGPDEALMRRLTEEAHADLRAQLSAAGINVLDAEATKPIIAVMDVMPGNMARSEIKAGITVGKSWKRGWVTFGAADAPLMPAMRVTSFSNASMAAFNGMAAGKMNKPAAAAGAVAIMPNLSLDFAVVDAETGSDFLGRKKASVDAAIGFRILTMSPVKIQAPSKDGRFGTPGAWYVKKDVVSTTRFATVEEGGAAVRVGSLTPIADENYITVQRARGDAVVVDVPTWEALVRDAYKAYNAAIVQTLLSLRK